MRRWAPLLILALGAVAPPGGAAAAQGTQGAGFDPCALLNADEIKDALGKALPARPAEAVAPQSTKAAAACTYAEPGLARTTLMVVLHPASDGLGEVVEQAQAERSEVAGAPAAWIGDILVVELGDGRLLELSLLFHDAALPQRRRALAALAADAMPRIPR